MRACTSLDELMPDTVGTRIALACGVFDGVHRGHRRIIAELREAARRNQATPVVLTFDPHPRAVLQPDSAPRLLTTTPHKLRILEQIGVQGVVVVPFSRALATMGPERFLTGHLLSSRHSVRAICVGSAWRFGAHGAGDTAFLARAGRAHGFELVSVPEFTLYRHSVSSTRT